MRKKVYIILIILSIGFVFANSTMAANTKSAKDLFNKSLDATAAGSGYTTTNARTAPQMVGLVIQIALSMLGIAFLILMIYAGMIWMNSRGNDKEVERAKDIIRNSIIGLVIVLAAYAITAFIGGSRLF